jgi:hypothetical protein
VAGLDGPAVVSAEERQGKRTLWFLRKNGTAGTVTVF